MVDEVVLTVRVPRQLAQQVRQMAQSRDETTSQVIRRGLRTYVSQTTKQNRRGDIVR